MSLKIFIRVHVDLEFAIQQIQHVDNELVERDSHNKIQLPF